MEGVEGGGVWWGYREGLEGGGVWRGCREGVEQFSIAYSMQDE